MIHSLFADPNHRSIKRWIQRHYGTRFAIDDASGTAMDFGHLLKICHCKNIVEGVVNVFKNMAEFFAQYINKDGFDFSGLVGGIIKKAVFGLLKALLIAAPVFAAGIFAFSAAKHIAKTMLLPKAEAFAMQMFAKGGDLAKKVANTAMGFVQSNR